jgi:hypothetical protein
MRIGREVCVLSKVCVFGVKYVLLWNMWAGGEVCVLGVKDICSGWSMCTWCEVCVLGMKYVYWMWSMCYWYEMCVLEVKYVYWVWRISVWDEVCVLGIKYVHWVWIMCIGCHVAILCRRQILVFNESSSISAHNDSSVFVCGRGVQPFWQRFTAVIVGWLARRTCWSHSNMST